MQSPTTNLFLKEPGDLVLDAGFPRKALSRFPQNRKLDGRGKSLGSCKHQFKKGESGNPGGRPRLLSQAYVEWLAETNRDGVSNAQHVAQGQEEMAIAGSTAAARLIWQITESDSAQETGNRNLNLDPEILELFINAARGPILETIEDSD